MTDLVVERWEKERRVLLDSIRKHPSRDLGQERDRLVVLNDLLKARGRDGAVALQRG